MNTCTIEFKLLDSKENIVYSDTISKSDLMKGSSYTYTFKYGFTSALSSSKYSWRVSGKCVDQFYLQDINKLDHDVIEFVIKKQIKESLVTLLCLY